jgi:branched-chain amino acid transport system substrate-binding protein
MKNGAVPTMPQAGVYAVVMHYLKAAVALNGGLGDGVAVVNKMKDIPTDDLLFGQGKIRIDGRNTPSAHLFNPRLRGIFISFWPQSRARKPFDH